MVKRRIYKDRKMQGIYDSVVATFRSGVQGWIRPGHHGMWREDGSRMRGASQHSTFWNGFDNTRPWSKHHRLPYVPGTMGQAIYMAGRDMARETKEK